ncbi:MAG: hypothetical protein HGJ94_21150 [Desulfosarcina sp.]|nr:hypothetical protein [Desulfosarcina sp.]
MTTSCHWAKNTVKARKMLTSPIGVSLLAAGAMHVVRSKEQAAVDAAGGDFTGRVDQWHMGYFDRMNMVGRRYANGAGGNCNLTSSKGVYVLTIYGAGGHTMAFARFSSRSVFFDPNFGQYSCKASLFSSFKNDIRNFLAGTYPSLQNKWYVYKVAL